MLVTPLFTPRVQPLVPGRVKVIHGSHDETFDNLVGRSVAVIQLSLQQIFNISSEASALVNGFEVGWDRRLGDRDVLEFVRRWGFKGGGPDQDSDFDYLTLSEAAKLIPGRTPGRKISLDSICRWCQRGVRGIRLKSVLIGGRRFTTRKWLADFIEASQKSESEYPSDVVPRTAKQLNQAAEDASRQLRSVWKNYRRQR